MPNVLRLMHIPHGFPSRPLRLTSWDYVRHFAFPFLGIFSRYYPILCHYAAEILIRPNDVKVNSDKGDNLIPNKGRIKPNKPFAGRPEKYIPRSIPVT